MVCAEKKARTCPCGTDETGDVPQRSSKGLWREERSRLYFSFTFQLQAMRDRTSFPRR